eukprot:350600-Chlamydomonas_euryale.AAC.3
MSAASGAEGSGRWRGRGVARAIVELLVELAVRTLCNLGLGFREGRSVQMEECDGWGSRCWDVWPECMCLASTQQPGRGSAVTQRGAKLRRKGGA